MSAKANAKESGAGVEPLSPWECLWRDVAWEISAGRIVQIAFLERALGELSKSELRVIERVYGIDGEPPQTIEELGQRDTGTVERLYRIENEAKSKLHDMFRPLTKAELRAKKALKEHAIIKKHIPMLLQDPVLLDLYEIKALLEHKKLLARALTWARKNLNGYVRQEALISKLVD